MAPILWDLLDDSGDAEPHDQIALGEEAIMRILLEDLANEQRTDVGIEGVDIADVLNRVECRHNPIVEPVAALCTERNFPWVSDEHQDCQKAHVGLGFKLQALDGQLVISRTHQSENLPTTWRLSGTAGERTVSCKSLPCAIGVTARPETQVVL